MLESHVIRRSSPEIVERYYSMYLLLVSVFGFFQSGPF